MDFSAFAVEDELRKQIWSQETGCGAINKPESNMVRVCYETVAVRIKYCAKGTCEIRRGEGDKLR